MGIQTKGLRRTELTALKNLSKFLVPNFSGDPSYVLVPTKSNVQDGVAIINNRERTKAYDHPFDYCLSTTTAND